MKRYVPKALLGVMSILGGMTLLIGCDDQGQATDNLLTNPGAMKYAANAVQAYFTPVDISDETTPVRELLQHKDPVENEPVTPWVPFHQKIPEHSKSFSMRHDGTSTVYKDNDSNLWYHVTRGAWASYYSTNPQGPDPGTQFHDVRGATESTWRERWHITWGPETSNYYNPSPGIDSMWVHIPSGFDASLYKPKGTTHVTTGANASLYTATATDVPDFPFEN